MHHSFRPSCGPLWSQEDKIYYDKKLTGSQGVFPFPSWYAFIPPIFIGGIGSYEFLTKCFNSIFYKELDESRICKNLQIPLCFGTAFSIQYFSQETVSVHRFLSYLPLGFLRISSRISTPADTSIRVTQVVIPL